MNIVEIAENAKLRHSLINGACMFLYFISLVSTVMTNSVICAEMIGKYSRSWTVHLSPQHLQEKENPLYREIIERIGIKKFTCKECGRDFTTNTSLEHHMVGTHNSHANTIRCDQCGKFFKSSDTLGKY